MNDLQERIKFVNRGLTVYKLRFEKCLKTYFFTKTTARVEDWILHPHVQNFFSEMVIPDSHVKPQQYLVCSLFSKTLPTVCSMPNTHTTLCVLGITQTAHSIQPEYNESQTVTGTYEMTENSKDIPQYRCPQFVSRASWCSPRHIGQRSGLYARFWNGCTPVKQYTWFVRSEVLREVNNNNNNNKVKWSCYRPGVAQRVGRGIALLFHDCSTRKGWVISSTPRPHFTPGKDPVPILQEARWAPGPVWTGGKSRPHQDSIPDCPAHSQSLYHLSYPAHNNNNNNNNNNNTVILNVTPCSWHTQGRTRRMWHNPPQIW